MEQAFRYRIYPTPKQEVLLRRTMAVRGWSTTALAARTEAWYERQERVDYIKTLPCPVEKQEDLQFHGRG